MGNATSKAAKGASKLSATSTARKYPPPSSNRTNAQPDRANPATQPGPTVHPKTEPSSERNQAIALDAADADLDLNARARALGPVVPNPTLSHSSTANGRPAGAQRASSCTRPNAAVGLLAARARLAGEAEREFGCIGKSGSVGRQFLDVVTLRQILVMRDRGLGAGEIERKLGLRAGVVGRLGRRRVVGPGVEM